VKPMVFNMLLVHVLAIVGVMLFFKKSLIDWKS
jgi:hypothetical protein